MKTIIAILSAILLFACQPQKPLDTEIFKEFYQPYSNYKSFKSKEPNLERQLNQGLEFYLNNNFVDAFDRFSLIMENFQTTVIIPFKHMLQSVAQEMEYQLSRRCMKGLFNRQGVDIELHAIALRNNRDRLTCHSIGLVIEHMPITLLILKDAVDEPLQIDARQLDTLGPRMFGWPSQKEL